MPEVTGTVSDPVRRISYILKAAGSPAAEIFAFFAKTKYDSMDILDLSMLPTLRCPSRTGNTDDSRSGAYITASLKMKHVQTKDGDRTCPRTKVKFTIQATLEPNDATEWTVTGYLKNGEMLMRPTIPGGAGKDIYVYPFSPILIGEVDDLATPLGLAMLKDSLAHVGIIPDRQSVAEEHGQLVTFEPGSDDSAHTSSLDSNSSRASSILAGIPNTAPSSEASRIRCGQEIERSLDRALISGLEPAFQPWMASTGATPPSARPPSSQSLPTDMDSGSSGSSPQRPRSTSPTKGRKRKKVADKAYKQPSIRSFLTPSPPTPPSPSKTSPPSRMKRRSQRHPPGEQPPPKKQARGQTAIICPEPQLPRQGQATSAGSFSPVEEILLEEVDIARDDSSQKPEADSSVECLGEVEKNRLVTIDLDNDITPDQSVLVISPPASASSSKAGSVKAPKAIRVKTEEGRSDPDMEPAPGSNSSGLTEAEVTLHTNLPIVQKPRHVFVKAERDHLSVKFLTFPAYNNLAEIVRCFFREEYEHDNPGSNQDLDEISIEQLLTPDASLDENVSDVISQSETFSSTDVQTFLRTSDSQGAHISSPAEVQVDNSVIEVTTAFDITVENPGTSIEEQQNEMQILRDMSLVIEDVRSAGEETLEQHVDDDQDDVGPTQDVEGQKGGKEEEEN